MRRHSPAPPPNVNLRPPEARRRQLLLRRVDHAAVVHALDLVGNVAARIMDLDRNVGICREEVGETQSHHHRRLASLHVERAVAACPRRDWVHLTACSLLTTLTYARTEADGTVPKMAGGHQ